MEIDARKTFFRQVEPAQPGNMKATFQQLAIADAAGLATAKVKNSAFQDLAVGHGSRKSPTGIIGGDKLYGCIERHMKHQLGNLVVVTTHDGRNAEDGIIQSRLLHQFFGCYFGHGIFIAHTGL